MAGTLLDQRRCRTAGVFESALLACVAAVFAILPACLVLQPEFAGVAEVSVALLLLPVAGVATVIVAWRVLGREEVIADGQSLRVSRRIGPLGRRWSMALSEVERASMCPAGRRELQSNFLGMGHPVVVVEGKACVIRCGVALTREQGSELAAGINAAVDEWRRRTSG